MTKATWCIIPPLPGYEASGAGEIRHGDRTIRQYQHNRRGYLSVVVRGQRHLVHRLILEAFAGPAPAGQDDAMHLDGNPRHNRLENLRWGSHAENMAMMSGDPRLSRHDETNPNRRLTRAVVAEIRARYDERDSYHWGRTELAASYGISNQQVLRIAQRKPGGWS